MTTLVPFYLKMHVMGEGPGATLTVLRHFFYLSSILLPKGDQPWVFFGRNDAKAETPVLWPTHAKS